MKKIILLLILFSFGLNAQNIIIEGIVRDTKDKEPLSYAHIFLKKRYIGTMANTKGAFRIIVPDQNKDDSIHFSFVGYKSQTFCIQDITDLMEVYLEQEQTTLQEIIVIGYTAKGLIKKALAKIPDNYTTKPYQFKGFYRVASQKNKAYVHLSEAVFDIYQAKTKPYRQFKLDKMRTIKDDKLLKDFDLGLKPAAIYNFDIINNLNRLEILSKKGLAKHQFKIEGTTLIDGKKVYKITFDKLDTKKTGYQGYMLIDKKSLAFIYFDFGFSPKIKSIKYGDTAFRALIAILGIDITISKDDYQIHYKKTGNKYYLNNVGNQATLTFKNDRENYHFKVDTKVDYLVTKINTGDIIPFENDKILRKSQLIEKKNSIYDANFWKNYTIILPTDDFNQIVKSLEVKNKANDLKLQIENRLFKLPKNKALRVDSILSFYNKKGLFNGNSLITYRGEVILSKSYNNDFTQNRLNSQFRIGSLSKSFTSMIILQQESQCKLNFNDTIGKFLPNYPNGNITIDQLLSHRSGIPDFLSNPDYIVKILSNKYSIEEVVDQFCSDSLIFKSGSQFEYSNSNFVILSLIAEKIIGYSFGEILNNQIFKPLGMKDTYFGKSVDSTNLVTAYMYGKPEPSYHAQNVAGTAGITSTVQDLLKWSKILDNELLLAQDKIKVLFLPRAEYQDWEAYYGYGWMIDRFMFSISKKHKIYYHPGTDLGFYSMFVKQPDSHITIILLNNTGDFPRFEITELILNELN